MYVRSFPVEDERTGDCDNVVEGEGDEVNLEEAGRMLDEDMDAAHGCRAVFTLGQLHRRGSSDPHHRRHRLHRYHVRLLRHQL